MKMELTEKILAGDVRAAARLMRSIEDGSPDAVEELKSIYQHTGKAYVIGVTGAPGAGKSTMVDALISAYRNRNLTVGVVAVDPSSPFTGGAILGDRVRMQKHSTDQGVFIRSLATRGWLGGLARAAISIIHIMDAMGKDVILAETVGIGQAEVDITRLADTTLFVLTPTAGDAIQMMKAGILEAADIFVVNKADQEGAQHLKVELQVMVSMKNRAHGSWEPPIVLTEAVKGKGIEELVAEIMKHKEYLTTSGEMEKRRKERVRLELVGAIEGSLKDYISAGLDQTALEKLIDDLMQKKTNPHSAASEIIDHSVKLGRA
jgi:LAO/AO transport system kinase